VRRATLRTTHDDPAVIAGAIAPDNTAEMETVVEDSVVRTRIERDTTSGLAATVDDYVVNLIVATRTVEHADAQHANRTDTETHHI
jgi:hypothetical protein